MSSEISHLLLNTQMSQTGFKEVVDKKLFSESQNWKNTNNFMSRILGNW